MLGTAPCATPPCTAIARTTNYGATWVGIPAPSDALENPQTGSTTPSVSEIRFGDNRNGWVFGPDLWSTHDGGGVWSRITTGPGASRVVDLASSGGYVYAVTEQCAGQTSSCPGQLWRSLNSSDDFQTVASFSQGPEDGYVQSILALRDNAGYLFTAPATEAPGAAALLITTNGTTWSPEPSPCPAQTDGMSVAPVDTVRAAVLCSGQGAAGSSEKSVFATSDGGHTWVPEGTAPPMSGDGGTLSAATVSTLGIATSSAATEIYLSVNGGATWTTPLTLDDGGEGWGDFGFTTSTEGFAIHAPIGRYQSGSAGGTPVDAGTMYVTSNAGATWSVVTF